MHGDIKSRRCDSERRYLMYKLTSRGLSEIGSNIFISELQNVAGSSQRIHQREPVIEVKRQRTDNCHYCVNWLKPNLNKIARRKKKFAAIAVKENILRNSAKRRQYIKLLFHMSSISTRQLRLLNLRRREPMAFSDFCNQKSVQYGK